MKIAFKEDFSYQLHTQFEESLYHTIKVYVDWKRQNQWDDYDEYTHSLDFIKQTIDSELWYHIHTVEKQQEIKGVLTIIDGHTADADLLKDFVPAETICLKYFHIVDKGAGIGRYWLESVIMPYYRERGFKNILVSSSHPLSFKFYSKFGIELKTFTKPSDNKLFERACKSFLIPIV